MTEAFPSTDQYGIVSQVRCSSSAVAASVAEGFGRGTTKEFLRVTQIARGELEETRYFMLLSQDLKGKFRRRSSPELMRNVIQSDG
jgi:four helix bundle protein